MSLPIGPGLGHAPHTLPARFFATARRLESRVAHYFHESGTRFPVGWSTAARLVRDIAAGLMALGHEPSDPVALVSSTRRELSYCDLAVLAAGGISVAIPPTLERDECQELLAHSDARICIVENAAQLAKLTQSALAELRHVIVVDPAPGRAPAGDEPGKPSQAPGKLCSLRQVMARGRERGLDVARRVDALSPLDAAMFLYTSGTTGQPKTVMLTHGNLNAAMEAMAALDWGEGDTALSYLPLSHGLPRVMEHYGLWAGATIAYAKSATGAADLKPTVIAAFPATLEQMVHELYDEIATSVAGQRLFAWASGLARETGELPVRGSLSPGIAARLALARRLVLQRLQTRLGGRVRQIVVMGGQLAHGVHRLFETVGISIVCGWGMAETCFAGTLGRTDTADPAGPGLPSPGIELALADDGELLVRGKSVFSGYYKAEAETAAAFSGGGYLRTGDLAAREPGGAYRVLGRKRDAIVTTTGKHIMPAQIEAWMRGDPRIRQAVVVGDGRPHLGALLCVSDALRQSCDEDTLHRIVEGIVSARNVEVERAEQVREFRLLPYPMSVATGELTSGFEIKRDVVLEKFGYLVNELYE